jgi:hypothetical protein
VDRERLLTEWKQALRQRILGPKLDVARKLYAGMVAGAVLTSEEASELRLDQSKGDIQDRLINLMSTLKQITLRIS